MCTLTVQLESDRILATMNRDEAQSRAPESPPVLHPIPGGGTWIAPHDGEKGGTWMGANSFGVVACLLNAYLPGESLLPDMTGRYRTRGEIIPTVLEQGDIDAAIRWASTELVPESYPSFNLLIFGGGKGRCITWHKQGHLIEQDIHDAWTLRSSSGWDSTEVMAWREELFDEWLKNGKEMVDHLPRFHLIRKEGREEWSPLMKRSWASTRSVTQVEINAERGDLLLRYWSDPQPDSKHPDIIETVALETQASVARDVNR